MKQSLHLFYQHKHTGQSVSLHIQFHIIYGHKWGNFWFVNKQQMEEVIDRVQCKTALLNCLEFLHNLRVICALVDTEVSFADVCIFCSDRSPSNVYVKFSVTEREFVPTNELTGLQEKAGLLKQTISSRPWSCFLMQFSNKCWDVRGPTWHVESYCTFILCKPCSVGAASSFDKQSAVRKISALCYAIKTIMGSIKWTKYKLSEMQSHVGEEEKKSAGEKWKWQTSHTKRKTVC